MLPIEVEILNAAMEMRAGATTFHGFGLAHAMRGDAGGRLVAHGTLYKALGRLEEMGLLTSRWEEDPPEGRPRRRLYELTASGVAAGQAHPDATDMPTIRPRLAPGTA